MGGFAGYVVAVNRTNGTSPGLEKVVEGKVHLSLDEAEEALEDVSVLPGTNADGSARASSAYGIYEATVGIGRRLDVAAAPRPGPGWVVLDIRADGYTIEAFDSSSSEDPIPDEVVTRLFDTSDVEWSEATARAEIDRLAASRGWPSFDVGLYVDRDILVGGAPVSESPRP